MNISSSIIGDSAQYGTGQSSTIITGETLKPLTSNSSTTNVTNPPVVLNSTAADGPILGATNIFDYISNTLNLMKQVRSVVFGDPVKPLGPGSNQTQNNQPSPASSGGQASSNIATPPAAAPAASAPISLVPASAAILKASGQMGWKPVGRTGTAAISFREELKGRISDVEILSANGANKLGIASFVRNNTDQLPTFRFDKPGNQYPPGSIILVKLTDGTSRYVEIPKPGEAFKY